MVLSAMVGKGVFVTEGRFPGDDIFSSEFSRRTHKTRKKVRLIPRLRLSLEPKFVRELSGGAIVVVFTGFLVVGLPKFTSSSDVNPAANVTSTTNVVTDNRITPSSLPIHVSGNGVDSAPTTLAQPQVIGKVGSGSSKPFRNVVSPSTRQVVQPTTTTSATIQSVVTSSGSAANSSVTVRVANGTSTPGFAGAITKKLASLNFNVVVPINATVSNLTTTTVYYYNGFEVAGTAIARVLGLPASSAVPYSSAAPLPDIYPSDVNVVLGSDIVG